MERESQSEDLQQKFYRTLIWYFEERPTGFYAQLGQVKDELGRLNERLEASEAASTKLTASLNKLTFWGVIIAGGGLIVAGANFVLEVVKYANGAG